MFLAVRVAAAAPPLASDSALYAAEGAHFDQSFEIWVLQGQVKDAGGRELYFSVSFSWVGNMFMQYRYCMVSLYDAAAKKYVYRSYSPVILVRAAMKELLDKAQRHPGEKRYAEAAARIKNKDYREVVPLLEESVVFKERLNLHFGPNDFERVDTKTFAYILNLVVADTRLNLNLRSDTDPLVYDSRRSIRTAAGGQLQGFAFPRLLASGSLRDASGKKNISGTVWYTHLWGDPGPSAMVDYGILSQRLDSGEAFQMFAFYAEGKKPAFFAQLLTRDGTLRDVGPSHIEKAGAWSSPVSDITYPTRWKVSSKFWSGVIRALYDNAEVSIAEGRGPLWLGPCSFTGVLKGRRVSGSGACWSRGPERK